MGRGAGDGSSSGNIAQIITGAARRVRMHRLLGGVTPAPSPSVFGRLFFIFHAWFAVHDTAVRREDASVDAGITTSTRPELPIFTDKWQNHLYLDF